MNIHKIKILFLAALVAMLANIALIPPKHAKAILDGGSFGGFIIAHIPPTLICPDIIEIFDMTGTYIGPIGLYLTPATIVFPNFNIFTPGTWVKGTYFPAPFPTCPGLTTGGIIMIGTS